MNMNMHLDFWNLIELLCMFFGAVFVMFRLLLWQFEKRQEERWAAQDQKAEQIEQFQKERWNRLNEKASKAEHVERQLLELRAELPLQYVRREDYILGQSVLMSKIDAVFAKIETLLIKGAKNDG